MLFRSPVLNPTNNGFWRYMPTPNIIMSLTQGEGLTWNIIGNKVSAAGGLLDGTTRGISGRVSRLSTSSLPSDTCLTASCATLSVREITGSVLGNYREYSD